MLIYSLFIAYNYTVNFLNFFGVGQNSDLTISLLLFSLHYAARIIYSNCIIYTLLYYYYYLSELILSL